MAAKGNGDRQRLPRHVGIIMDGNGRWAKKHGVPRNLGHKNGADVFGKIVRYAQKIGIPYLTVYAFSTENWKRPPEEIEGIMSLLRTYLSNMEQYAKEGIRLFVLGEREPLDGDIRRLIARAEEASAANTGITVNIALNYGGREEIVHAAKELLRRCAEGELEPSALGEAAFADCLYTAGQPDVDLVIRTSGEMRISNFLLWQSAYAEFVFSDVLWPDFTPRHFDAALREYAARERRMGGR